MYMIAWTLFSGRNFENGTYEGLLADILLQYNEGFIFVLFGLAICQFIVSIFLIIRGYKKPEDQRETRLDRIFKLGSSNPVHV